MSADTTDLTLSALTYSIHLTSFTVYLPRTNYICFTLHYLAIPNFTGFTLPYD